jgi:hypothetical protein
MRKDTTYLWNLRRCFPVVCNRIRWRSLCLLLRPFSAGPRLKLDAGPSLTCA